MTTDAEIAPPSPPPATKKGPGRPRSTPETPQQRIERLQAELHLAAPSPPPRMALRFASCHASEALPLSHSLRDIFTRKLSDVFSHCSNRNPAAGRVARNLW